MSVESGPLLYFGHTRHVVERPGGPGALQRYQLLAGLHEPQLQCPETVKTKVLDRTNV